ncbi:MAG: hypothetical protein KJO82_15345, partial [Gammaproteobacteria bacterium]|nr:hypothetical protein [Gammaproteobacteria bacterium]
MKYLSIVKTAVFALLIGVSPALAQQPQLINLPLTRPGEPVTLDIGIQSARIEVIGEQRDDAQFEIMVADGRRKIVTPSGTQSLKGGGYTLEVEEDDNEISVDTDWRTNKVDVKARIPLEADLYLDTINDGEIIVNNIRGNLELQNTNGPITAKNISGSVIAESINDTIDVSFSRIDDVSATSFESINGDLILTVPANAGVRLFLDTAQGEIFSDFEVDVEPTKPTIERNEGRSGVEVRIESVIIANINGGGPVVR